MENDLFSHVAQNFLKRVQNTNREPPQGGEGDDKEWGYIPWSAESFITLIENSKAVFREDVAGVRPAYGPITFLEVGCGRGWLTLLAETMGFQATGLEKVDGYTTTARAICGDKAIIQADALEFNDYGKYDIIYFYMPFKAPLLQKELVNRIMSQARGVIASPFYGIEKTKLAIPVQYGVPHCIYSMKRKCHVRVEQKTLVEELRPKRRTKLAKIQSHLERPVGR